MTKEYQVHYGITTKEYEVHYVNGLQETFFFNVMMALHATNSGLNSQCSPLRLVTNKDVTINLYVTGIMNNPHRGPLHRYEVTGYVRDEASGARTPVLMHLHDHCAQLYVGADYVLMPRPEKAVAAA